MWTNIGVLRGPPWTKGVAVAVLRGPSWTKGVAVPAHRTRPHNLSEPLTFCTIYCNNRKVPARRPLPTPCTVCSPAKEHRYIHVALFHLPTRTDLPPPAQDRRPPGDPHSCCRSILMRTKSPQGKHAPPPAPSANRPPSSLSSTPPADQTGTTTATGSARNHSQPGSALPPQAMAASPASTSRTTT